MADQEGSNVKLSDLFNDIFDIWTYLNTTDNPTSSDCTQGKIRNGVEKAHKGIEMVNELGVFSCNENIEEVSTNEVRYMLLPGLLAFFTLNITIERRLDVLKRSLAYYTDFLRLCKFYSLTDINLPTENETRITPRQRSSDLAAMSNSRQIKIQKYKEQKQIEESLKELHAQVNRPHVDDEVKREYYLTMLKRWITRAEDDIECIQDEIPIAEHLEKTKAREKEGKENIDVTKMQLKPKQSFRPFILTRDKVQSAVFGAGYPGVPTMTVEEWAEQEMAAGRLPQPGSSQSAVIDGPTEAKKNEDKDAARTEEKEEQDDPDTLREKREWDDWKDDHRRGWGNRQNMG